ncbi:MAG: glycerophosphodiester phosphodiesterase [Sporichthyaceae bacterium]
MAFPGDQSTVIGHRGLGGGTVEGHRENTLGSFMAAAASGVDWLEVDVRRTSDDVLVVAHDPAYDDGMFHIDTTAAMARERGTLLLDDLLASLPPDVGIDFDLKSSMEDAARPATGTTAALLAPIAAREARGRPVAVSSFDPAALLTTRMLAPDVPTGLLTWLRFPIGQAVSAAAHLDVDFLAVHMGSVRPTPIEPEVQQRPLDYIVSLLHGADRQVMAWCPKLTELARVLGAGVDAVCVNDVPSVLRQLRPQASSAATED